MGESKHLLNRGAEPEQHERFLQLLRAFEHFDEGGDAGAVDVTDGCQVKGQRPHGRQSIEESTAEVRRRAQIHISVHFHDLGRSHITNGNFHVLFLRYLLATKRFPSGDSS